MTKQLKMPPDILDPSVTLDDNDIHDNNVNSVTQRVTKKSELLNKDSQINSSDNMKECHTNQVFKPQIIWFELIAQIFLHTGFLVGAYYLLTLQAQFFTYIWCKYNLEK